MEYDDDGCPILATDSYQVFAETSASFRGIELHPDGRLGDYNVVTYIHGDPEIAGSFRARITGSRVTIEYDLFEQFWGQGIGTRMLTGFVEQIAPCFGVSTIEAFVDPSASYVASRRVLEKNGFKTEGSVASGIKKGFTIYRRSI